MEDERYFTKLPCWNISEVLLVIYWAGQNGRLVEESANGGQALIYTGLVYVM